MRFKILPFLMALALAPSLFAGTTGGLRGVIYDEKGAPVAMAIIIVTSPSLQGRRELVADDNGQYIVSDLPPGTYKVSAAFLTAVSEREQINVSIDKVLQIDLALNLSGMQGEVYTIISTPPNVDVASSTLGVSISKEFLEKVPLGASRDWISAVTVAPSADRDARGVNIGGATSPENNFVIDGIPVRNTQYGLVGATLNKEFIEDFEVKEGGYGPEYGRATGGFINAVTKSGGNEFHGSVFAYYTPDFLAIDPKIAGTQNSSFRISTKNKFNLNTGFELGGPIVKDVLWFQLGYVPDITSSETTRAFHYVPGKDGKPIRDPFGALTFLPTGQSDKFSIFSVRHEYLFKLTHLINNDNRHSIALHGSPIFQSNWNVGPLLQEPYDATWQGFLGDGVYSYDGQFFNKSFKVSAKLGAHIEQTNIQPKNPNLLRRQFRYTEPLYKIQEQGLFGGTLPAECAAANDFTGGSRGSSSNPLSPCFTSNFNVGGFGGYSNGLFYRFAENVTFTNVFEAAGVHQFKYGFDFEQDFSKPQRKNTGSSINFIFPPDTYGAGETVVDKFGWGKSRASDNGWDYRSSLDPVALNTNWALFVGDSWNPIFPLTLNYGVRWDVQNFYGAKSAEAIDEFAIKFSFWDNIAPRAGLIWDFTKKGRGAIRFNYGRYYESIPQDLNIRSFGQEVFLDTYHKCPNATATTVADPEAKDSGCTNISYGPNADADWATSAAPINDTLVQTGMKSQYTDELLLSADYELFDSWVFGVGAIYSSIGSVVEDLSVDGADTYIIGNPGPFEINSIDQLRRDLLKTTDPKKREIIQSQIDSLPLLGGFPSAVRKNLSLRFMVDKKLSDHFSILGSYQLSWIYGNYPGPLSANNNQLGPVTSMFDLPTLLVNRMGYLQQDRRHNIKMSGYYAASLRDLGLAVPLTFTLGLTANVTSGLAYDVIGRERLYGSREVFMLPRATGGRLPWNWTVDANVGIGYDFDDQTSLEVFAGLFNVTNNQEITDIDFVYTGTQVVPVPGADKNQLLHMKGDRGQVVVPSANFGNTSAFQTPFRAQIGARLKF